LGGMSDAGPEDPLLKTRRTKLNSTRSWQGVLVASDF